VFCITAKLAADIGADASLWVIRDRGESAASLAMSVIAPKAEVNSEH
jgi:hypothetical protein